MITNLEVYETFVMDVMEKTPLLKTQQLKIMLYKYFQSVDKDMTPDFAESIIFAVQRRARILLTPDGWCMTKGQYKKILCNHAEEKIKNSESVFRLPEMDEQCSKINPSLINLMWIIAYEMPKSIDYVVGTFPWQVMYITKATSDTPSRLYQFAYISKNEDRQTCMLLKSMPKVGEEFKSVTRRIVLLENEESAPYVPFIGISHILALDEQKKGSYHTVEARKILSERWKDND